DTVGHLYRAVELQAAIRPVVSAGADRNRAMESVHHRRDRRGRDGIRLLARLRHRELAGLLSLDTDVLAGLPDRGQGPLVEVAEPVRAGALFRRHRTVGLDISMDHDRCGRSRAGADVAQPNRLSAEGGGARGRY